MVHIGTFHLPVYLMIISAAHAALFYRRDRDRAATLARARLDSLTAQLQPHFLFNTLNAIAELVHEDANRADMIVTALSDMLRLTLDVNAARLVPLAREIELIERYLAIMQARFGDRVRYQCDIAAEARDALVPPFLLHPLVENAILHGLQPKPGGGTVRIVARVIHRTLRLCVCDDGVGLTSGVAPEREGLGLRNTRARLQELYEDAAQVSLRDEAGAVVEVKLPFQTDGADQDLARR